MTPSPPSKLRDHRVFGEIALDLGFLESEELASGLAHQRSLFCPGARSATPLIGVVLVALGYMTPEQVCRVIEVQEAEELRRAQRFGAVGGIEREARAEEGCRAHSGIDALPA